MNKLLRSAICLMIVTMISKIFGFFRQLTLTSVYGANEVADVFLTSMSIPLILFTSIGTAIGTIFIPLFQDVYKSNGKEKSLEFANNVINIVIILSTVIAILGFIFAEPLVKIFAMNFKGEKLLLAVEFTRIMIFGVIFIGITKVMTAWLQLNENFVVPGMIGFPYNIFIIGGILFSSIGDLKMMPIAALVAMISQFLFQLPFAIKHGYRYKLHIDINDKYMKQMMALVIPVFIGASVDQINKIVDGSLASTLGDGMITVLSSANKLNEFVMGLFILSISSVVYPLLSKLSSDNNKQEFAKTITKSLNVIILLAVPISIGAIVLAEPIVKIIFERGAFNSDATIMTSRALACYSIGIIGFSIMEIMNKVFYSIKDTKTPMINGGFSIVINIVLNLMTIKFLGYIGLALSTSISSLICILLMFRSLYKKIGDYGINNIIKTSIKVLISSVIMGFCTIGLYRFLIRVIGVGVIKEVASLFITIVVGAIVYFTLITLFKVEETKIAFDLIKKIKYKKLLKR